jgi:hypothetical protein
MRYLELITKLMSSQSLFMIRSGPAGPGDRNRTGQIVGLAPRLLSVGTHIAVPSFQATLRVKIALHAVSSNLDLFHSPLVDKCLTCDCERSWDLSSRGSDILTDTDR